MQSHRAHRRPVRGLVALGLLLPVAVALGLLLRASDSVDSSPAEAPPPRPVAAPATPASGAAVEAARVLRTWDRARAAAWADGSVRALRRLYVEGAGASDVRLLESYADRGLRATGLRMQLLAVVVLAHEPGEWRVRVTDRLASATVVGAGAARPLPRDRATTRELRLVRDRGGWRMAAVR